MSLGPWNDSYSVEIGSLDEQHKRLFSLINSLHDAMKQGKGNSIAEQILNNLIAYTSVHFAAEEAMLQKAAYPGLTQHQKEHREFTVQVAAFVEEHHGGKVALSISLMNFLQSWLIHHICKVDKDYSGFLRARGAC